MTCSSFIQLHPNHTESYICHSKLETVSETLKVMNAPENEISQISIFLPPSLYMSYMCIVLFISHISLVTPSEVPVVNSLKAVLWDWKGT